MVRGALSIIGLLSLLSTALGEADSCDLLSSDITKRIQAGEFVSSDAWSVMTSGVLANGASLTVSCDTSNGFYEPEDGISAQTVSCVDGVLEPLVLDCRKMCNPPKKSTSVIFEGSKLFHGSKWVASCAPGHYPSNPDASSQQLLVCINGAFSELALKCTPGCSAFSLPSSIMAQMDVQPPEVLKSSSLPNAIARVKCKNGLTPLAAQGTKLTTDSEGYVELRCSNGAWPRPSFTCSSGCPKHDFEKEAGYLLNYSKSANGDVFAPGVTATVQCDSKNGYLPVEDAQNSGVSECRGNEWSFTPVKCLKVCDSPAVAFKDSTLSPHYAESKLALGGTNSRTSQHLHGSIIRFSCAPDHTPSWGSGEVTATCNRGKWVSQGVAINALTCYADCDTLDANALIVRDPETQKPLLQLHGIALEQLKEDSFHRHGAVVSFSCVDGARSLSGQGRTSSVVCQDGRWSPLHLECGMSCTSFDMKSSGYVVKGEGVTTGSKRLITCDKGFRHVSGLEKDVVTCSKFGVWSSPTITCSRDCPAPKLSMPFVDVRSNPENMIVDNSTISHLLVGGAANYTVAQLMQGGIPGDTELTFKCNPLHFSPRDGQAVDFEDSIRCSDGKWSSLSLTCARHCSDIQAEMELLAEDADTMLASFASPTLLHTSEERRTHHGSQYLFTCRAGATPHPPAPGSSLVTCHDGTWTALDIECRLPCRRYPNNYIDTTYDGVPQGQIIGDILPTPSETVLAQLGEAFVAPHGSSVSVRCSNAFSNTHVLAASTTAVGESTCVNGKWMEPMVDCKKMCLEYDADAERFTFEYDSTPVIFESNAQVTTAMGSTNYLLTKFAKTILTKYYSHNTKLSMACLDGITTPEDTDYLHETLTCVDGAWTPRALECRFKCEPLPAVQEGYHLFPLSGTNEHGDTRIIQCVRDPLDDIKYPATNWKGWTNGYFDALGVNKQQITCEDGKWTPMSLICLKKCPPFVPSVKGLTASPADTIQSSTIIAFNETLYAHGANRKLTCTTGYSDPNIAAQYDFTQCVDGRWSDESIDCRKQCKSTEFYRVDPNAYGANLPVIGQVPFKYFDHQTVVDVKCQPGYSYHPPLDTEERRMAFSRVWCIDGEWSMLGARCLARCKAYKDFDSEREMVVSMNKTYHLANWEPATETYSHLSEITVQCRPGLYDAQNYNVTEEVLTCVDGAWTHQNLRCRRSCPAFTGPVEAFRYAFLDLIHLPEYTADTGKKEAQEEAISTIWEAHVHGAHRTIICNRNETGEFEAFAEKDNTNNKGSYIVKGPFFSAPLYHADGSTYNIETQTTTCVDGEWSGFSLKCVRQCPDPYTMVTNHEAFVFSGRPLGTPANHGDKMTVACGSNYMPVVGLSPQTITCEDGTWTSMNLQCEKPCMPYRQWAEMYDQVVLTGCLHTTNADDEGKNGIGSSALRGMGEAVNALNAQKAYANGEEHKDVSIQKYCRNRYLVNGDSELPTPNAKVHLTCAPGTSPSAMSTAAGRLTQTLRCKNGMWDVRELTCEHVCLNSFTPNIPVGVEEWDDSVHSDPYSVSNQIVQWLYEVSVQDGNREWMALPLKETAEFYLDANLNLRHQVTNEVVFWNKEMAIVPDVFTIMATNFTKLDNILKKTDLAAGLLPFTEPLRGIEGLRLWGRSVQEYIKYTYHDESEYLIEQLAPLGGWLQLEDFYENPDIIRNRHQNQRDFNEELASMHEDDVSTWLTKQQTYRSGKHFSYGSDMLSKVIERQGDPIDHRVPLRSNTALPKDDNFVTTQEWRRKESWRNRINMAYVYSNWNGIEGTLDSTINSIGRDLKTDKLGGINETELAIASAEASAEASASFLQRKGLHDRARELRSNPLVFDHAKFDVTEEEAIALGLMQADAKGRHSPSEDGVEFVHGAFEDVEEGKRPMPVSFIQNAIRRSKAKQTEGHEEFDEFIDDASLPSSFIEWSTRAGSASAGVGVSMGDPQPYDEYADVGEKPATGQNFDSTRFQAGLKGLDAQTQALYLDSLRNPMGLRPTAWAKNFVIIAYKTNNKARITGKKYRSGSQVNLQCGRTWSSPSETQTNQLLSCYDGKWDGQQVYCYPSCFGVDMSIYPGIQMVSTYTSVHTGAVINPIFITGKDFGLYPLGTVVDVTCAGKTEMVPRGASTLLRCADGTGKFSAPEFECITHCPLPPEQIEFNFQRYAQGKDAVAFFIAYGDFTEAYINSGDLIGKYPELLRHGGEYQMMCASKSVVGKPYRVRNFHGGRSTLFELTASKATFKNSGNFITSGLHITVLKFIAKMLLKKFFVWALMFLAPFLGPFAFIFIFLAQSAVIKIPFLNLPIFDLLSFISGKIVDKLFEGQANKFTSETTQRNQEQVGANMPGLVSLRRGGGGSVPWTNTSAMVQYYGFWCNVCGELEQQKNGRLRKVGSRYGPFKRVQCWGGQWTDNSFSCANMADLTEKSRKSSRCVLCSHSWREGRANPIAMQGDSEFGARVPPLLMQGYHLWAPFAIRTSERSPILNDLVTKPIAGEAARLLSGMDGGLELTSPRSVFTLAFLLAAIPFTLFCGAVAQVIGMDGYTAGERIAAASGGMLGGDFSMVLDLAITVAFLASVCMVFGFVSSRISRGLDRLFGSSQKSV